MNAREQNKDSTDESVLLLVTQALARLRYGTITITVHEGRVTVIDTTERTRLAPLR